MTTTAKEMKRVLGLDDSFESSCIAFNLLCKTKVMGGIMYIGKTDYELSEEQKEAIKEYYKVRSVIYA